MQKERFKTPKNTQICLKLDINKIKSLNRIQNFYFVFCHLPTFSHLHPDMLIQALPPFHPQTPLKHPQTSNLSNFISFSLKLSYEPLKILITQPQLEDIFSIFIFIIVRNTEAFSTSSSFHWASSREQQKAFNIKIRVYGFSPVISFYDALKTQSFAKLVGCKINFASGR